MDPTGQPEGSEAKLSKEARKLKRAERKRAKVQEKSTKLKYTPNPGQKRQQETPDPETQAAKWAKTTAKAKELREARAPHHPRMANIRQYTGSSTCAH